MRRFLGSQGTSFCHEFSCHSALALNEPSQICTLAPICGRSLVTIERDGSLYSCERFVYPEYRLGNLLDAGCRLADVVYSDRQRQFGCNKRDTLTDCCRRCPYRFACHGECPKNRFIKSPDGQPGHNYLCSGLRRFFAYADPYLRQLAGQVLRNRAVGSQPKRATARSAIDTKLQQSTG